MTPEEVVSASRQWSVAFACSLMNFMQTAGFFFTSTTLMPLIVSDLGLSLAVSTVPIAVGKISYVAMLFPGGICVDRFGPRRCVLLGIAGLATLLSIYSCFVSTFPMVITLHILMALASSVSGVPVYSLFIAQWFQTGSIGVAMGLTLAGFSMAGTLIPAVLGPIGAEFGWRAAMGCMATFLWLVAFPIAWMFLVERPDDEEEDEQNILGEEAVARDSADADPEHGETQPLLGVSASASVERLRARLLAAQRDAAPAQQQQQEDAAAESLLASLNEPAPPVDNKSWTFLGFSLNYMLLQYAFGSFGENILFWLTIDRTYTLATASLFFSALNLSAFTAKLVGGHLGDKFDRFIVGSILSGVASLGVVCLFLGGGISEDGIPTLTSSPIFLASFSILFGFGYGGVFNCLYVLVPLVFGRKNLGRIQSSLFGLGLIGNACGSIVTGVLRARYGSYDRSFLIAGASCVTNFFIFNVTRRSLGGTMAGLKTIEDEAEAAVDPAVLAQLAAEEEALKSRIGPNSESNSVNVTPVVTPGITPGVTPVGSYPSLYGSTFFGAAFRSSPSVELLLNSSPHTSVGGAVGVPVPAQDAADSTRMPDSAENDGSSAASSVGSVDVGSAGGVSFESGFPYAREWSSGSLQRIAQARRRRREDAPASSNVPGNSGPAAGSPRPSFLRSSGTFENLISSGIMSQSFEDIGYAGHVGVEQNVPPSQGRPPVAGPSGLPSRAHVRRSGSSQAVHRSSSNQAVHRSGSSQSVHRSGSAYSVGNPSSAQRPPMGRSSSSRQVRAVGALGEGATVNVAAAVQSTPGSSAALPTAGSPSVYAAGASPLVQSVSVPDVSRKASQTSSAEGDVVSQRREAAPVARLSPPRSQMPPEERESEG